MYKRMFDSFEKLDWLVIHKPHKTTVRQTTQGDGFVIEGPVSQKVRIDEFVKTFASDLA